MHVVRHLCGDYFFRRRVSRFVRILPNDKHEDNYLRRTYTLMSAEDVANGKKWKWTELEITALISNLSPTLW